MHLQEEIIKRGFLKQVTNEDVFRIYDRGGQVLYYGVDPTSDSLHLGNFVGFMHAIQYIKRNNSLVIVVGGATGMIGDPGGKDAERVFLDNETIEYNVASITTQVKSIVSNFQDILGYKFDVKIINNALFYRDMTYIRFLRDVGKHITVNQMIKKETVRRRLFEKDKFISYTEFSYMLMQAYDFYMLCRDYKCLLQIAGSDQWGNVVTGVELIRKKLDKEAYGVTTNLIVDASGKKFGKSEGNALWLDKKKNNPLVIYQYFVNTCDEDLERYFKLFTLLSFEEISKILKKHEEFPDRRYAQLELAYCVTQMIFGKLDADHARDITAFLFQTNIEEKKQKLMHMDFSMLSSLYNALGGKIFHQSGDSLSVLDVCVYLGLSRSKSEAKKMVQQGSLYVYNKRIDDISYVLSEEDWVNDVILLKKGKKTRKMLWRK